MSPLTSYLVETLVTLLAIVALAVLVLVSARRIGIGKPLGPMQLVGRLPLDGRRVVYLVRVADRVFVLAASEAGVQKVGELEAHSVRTDQPEQADPFRQALARVLNRPKEPPEQAKVDPESRD